ncbi:SPASM domain-containing protein [Streptomyces decoyicus]|uniref:SPASM domain-containing protein n=1 Tax=Streptomyces decoyicus TaxID=249567 RepID=UPI0033AC1C5B
MSKPCGQCGQNKMAISPEGDVWPCVFARWMAVGNVHHHGLRDVYNGVPMQGARTELSAVFPEKAPEAGGEPSCLPDCNPSFDTCSPQLACAPDAACAPTEGSDRLKDPIMSPQRSVRYSNPRIAGTDC